VGGFTRSETFQDRRNPTWSDPDLGVPRRPHSSAVIVHHVSERAPTSPIFRCPLPHVLRHCSLSLSLSPLRLRPFPSCRIDGMAYVAIDHWTGAHSGIRDCGVTWQSPSLRVVSIEEGDLGAVYLKVLKYPFYDP